MKKRNFQPKLAVPNFIEDTKQLKRFAVENRFEGVDWSFDIEKIPFTPSAETYWVKQVDKLDPLEIRYHCPFMKVDLGHEDGKIVTEAMMLFQRIIKLVSKAGGKYLSLHIGLGHDTTRILSWNKTIENLRRIVQFGAERNITICLENLAWGWTSKPNLFEKLIRKTGAGVTYDIGHAHVCEAVRTQQFSAEDFVMPHSEKVYIAHVYHKEIQGVGHLPPDRIEDVYDRLNILKQVGCLFWVIEIREVEGLLKTGKIIRKYLKETAA